MSSPQQPEIQHSSQEKNQKETLILYILAAIMFTVILDFMIVMPLGPQLMTVWSIGASEFGLIVSAYTFSAGVTGLLAAFFIDRFDRKNLTLFLYIGFTIGTLLCAVSTSHVFMIVARIITGAFGGVLGAVVFSIIGDIVPYSRRGAAMGIVMTAFSAASVAGVPFGLFLASLYGWHSPFFLLVGLCVLLSVFIYFVLPNLKSHLEHHVVVHPFETIKVVFTNKNHLWAFSLMLILMLSGFSVIPYIATYMSKNVGVSAQELSLVYLFGGLATIFSSRIFGKLADKYGKLKVFTANTILCSIPIIGITNWPVTSIWMMLPMSTFFFIVLNGRMVPAMAMISASASPKIRGSFMSFNSSVQQISSGIASLVAGLIIGSTISGELTNYWIVGVGSVVLSFAAIFIARKVQVLDIQQHKSTEAAAEPVVMEG